MFTIKFDLIEHDGSASDKLSFAFPGSDTGILEAESPTGALARGRLLLGNHTEKFESPLHYWKRKDYESHWRSVANRIIAGAAKSAFITAMYDPALANFLIWWPVYRVGEHIYVQNQLLFLENLAAPFSSEVIDDIVDSRSTVNDEGEVKSEWSVTVEDFMDFASNASAQDGTP